MAIAPQLRFVYHQSVNAAASPDRSLSLIAAAIGEPARVRILYCLLDGRARTSTELSVVAEVSPSTTSVHLNRLKAERLVKVFPQGKHHYYSLHGPDVAAALEALHVVAGSRRRFAPNTPAELLAARTCYDHLAGRLGVLLHNRLIAMKWLRAMGKRNDYELTNEGTAALSSLGIDVTATRALRRRLAYACLDWSERQPHVGGALAAGLLQIALRNKWLVRELDSRVLSVTSAGRREMLARFGINLQPAAGTKNAASEAKPALS